jgi:IclR family acetate operon transcriptional repressor
MDTALTNELRERLKLKTRTPHTIGNWSALDPELAGIRQRGYAVDEQEYHLGVRCIAIPLLDHAGLVLGALGLTGATRTLTKARLPELAGILQTARERLLEDL